MDLEIDFKFKDIKNIDFSYTFKHLLRDPNNGMIEDLKFHIMMRKQVDGSQVRDNSPFTQKLKGKNHWSVDTEEFVNNAFKGKSTKDYSEVRLSNNAHQGSSGQYTYKSLAMRLNEYADAKQFGITKRIKKFIKSNTFKKWVVFDIKRAIAKAQEKRKRVKI
ncbi:MAG: hypothetical protein GY714_20900 [Desulfobacterales bacterium]|nr:hypothetical protein [Desulfobacterales bacterium]